MKQPQTIQFKAMSESATEPKFVDYWGSWDSPEGLHHVFQALYKYQEAHGGNLPARGDTAAIEELQQLVPEAYKEQAATVGSMSSAEISPMCSVMGGVVAQEVLKACTGKFMPIDQWIYFDATECAPDAYETVTTVCILSCRS